MVRRRIRKFLASATVDVIIRVVVVLSLAVGGVAFYQNRQLTKCVAAYNNTNNARTVALTNATNEERNAGRRADDAQAALFLSPLVGKTDQTPAEHAEVLRLFRAYQVALTEQKTERATADDARRDHPIPDPPSAVCG
jgi:uncharacterized protein HemX